MNLSKYQPNQPESSYIIESGKAKDKSYSTFLLGVFLISVENWLTSF